jgi:hypothetical protein
MWVWPTELAGNITFDLIDKHSTGYDSETIFFRKASSLDDGHGRKIKKCGN